MLACGARRWCALSMMVHTMKRVQSNASPPPKLATRRTHDAAFKRRLVELTVSGRRSHLLKSSCGREDRVHLIFWWTREHFEWLHRSAPSAQAQRGVQGEGCSGLLQTGYVDGCGRVGAWTERKPAAPLGSGRRSADGEADGRPDCIACSVDS